MTKNKRRILSNRRFRGKARSRDNHDQITIQFYDYVIELSATSAIGAVVQQNLEIETTLSAIMTAHGNMYAYWRLNWVEFEFRSQRITTDAGHVGLVYVPDPDVATPTTINEFLSSRINVTGHVYSNITLFLRPESKEWKYTKDGALLEDRLEHYGNLIVWSNGALAAVNPGSLVARWNVSFKELYSSDILAQQGLSFTKALSIPMKEPPDDKGSVGRRSGRRSVQIS